jgi:hypothetical protein
LQAQHKYSKPSSAKFPAVHWFRSFYRLADESERFRVEIFGFSREKVKPSRAKPVVATACNDGLGVLSESRNASSSDVWPVIGPEGN